MSDDCPSFLEVTGYLAALVISAAIFLYLILYLLVSPIVQPSVYFFILVCFVIIAYAKIQLFRMLFPARAEWLQFRH